MARPLPRSPRRPDFLASLSVIRTDIHNRAAGLGNRPVLDSQRKVPPSILVSVASKGFSNPITALESTAARKFVIVDSKEFASTAKSEGSVLFRTVAERKTQDAKQRPESKTPIERLAFRSKVAVLPRNYDTREVTVCQEKRGAGSKAPDMSALWAREMSTFGMRLEEESGDKLMCLGAPWREHCRRRGNHGERHAFASVAAPLSRCHNPNLLSRRSGTRAGTIVSRSSVRILRGLYDNTR